MTRSKYQSPTARRTNANRRIPAVEKVLRHFGPLPLPRPVVTAIVRRELAALRQAGKVPPAEEILHHIGNALQQTARSRIQPVLNGTGIIVHTNLGRAPLSQDAISELSAVAAQYNNLEFDLTLGARGKRGEYLETCLALLCEAEAATAVNNCAAALILILCHFIADRTEVVISRGELVQIGGGFRIPEILEASGARLREVGTTNRTTLQDYAKALSSRTALVLKVHRSNFFMDGFVAAPATAELAALARKKRVPLVEDLGSGALLETERYAGIEHEPRPAEVLRQGVDLICFSGDKLMGGPQAGIIAGKSKWVKGLKQEPLFRALRCDKLILTGLQATAEAYLHMSGAAEAGSALPIYAMLETSLEQLQDRAARLCQRLQGLPLRCSVGSSLAKIGGGTLPRSTVPSATIDLVPASQSVAAFGAQLRHGQPPVVGYVSGRQFRVDLRTIPPEQDERLAAAIRRVSEMQPPTGG